MARQAGPIYLSGTVGGVTFYRMGSGYFARRKTSLNKERFYSDKAFGRSRIAANVFGSASKIASQVYRMLPRNKRGHGVIGKLSGAANRLMHESKSKEEVLLILMKDYMDLELVVVEVKEPKSRKNPLPRRPKHIKRVGVPGIDKRFLFGHPNYTTKISDKVPAPT